MLFSVRVFVRPEDVVAGTRAVESVVSEESHQASGEAPRLRDFEMAETADVPEFEVGRPVLLGGAAAVAWLLALAVHVAPLAPSLDPLRWPGSIVLAVGGFVLLRARSKMIDGRIAEWEREEAARITAAGEKDWDAIEASHRHVIEDAWPAAPASGAAPTARGPR